MGADGQPDDLGQRKAPQYALFVRPEVITLAKLHKVVRDVDALSERIQRLGANLDHRLYMLTEPPTLDDAE